MYSGMRAPFPGYFGIFCDISHMTFETELVLSALLGQGKACAPEVCGSSCFSLCVAQALVPASLWTSALQFTPGLTPASRGLGSISVLLPGPRWQLLPFTLSPRVPRGL